MFKLLHSIFGGGEQRGRYPASLVDLAIERAVDSTDPRLRALPGYANKLRVATIKAIDHVVELVNAIQEPLEVATATYSGDPRLGALFASAETMIDVLGRDQTLRDYLDSSEGHGAPRVTALLLAERVERQVLGMELVGDQVRRDVAQVAVSFFGHRLLEPNRDPEETRRLLKRRAFDFILTQALDQISEMKVERADLSRQRDLIKRKLTTLERCGWCFNKPEPDQSGLASLMAELDEISTQLQALGPDQNILEANLDILGRVLDQAELQLRAESITLFLDAMNIVRPEDDPSARRIDLIELRGGRGQRAIMLHLVLAPDQLPARVDFLTAVEHYL